VGGGPCHARAGGHPVTPELAASSPPSWPGLPCPTKPWRRRDPAIHDTILGQIFGLPFPHSHVTMRGSLRETDSVGLLWH
jgi:hypothetical protein